MFLSFWMQLSKVAVLFYWNLSRCPFLWQVVDLDLLLCTGFNSAVLFPCHIFTQRPMTERKIELRDGQPSWALLCNNFSPIPLKFSFHMKKKVTCCSQKFSIKTLLILELSQYSKSGSMFSSSEPVAAVANLEMPCVCSRQSDQRKKSQRAAPRAWPLILPSKPSIVFWNSLQRNCHMTGRGSNLDSNLNSAAWPTSCKGFIASEITA